jgi:hypothetical protein
LVKSGQGCDRQRYKCKDCGYDCIIGDGRTSEKIVALKALYVVFHSLSKGSYNMPGKIFEKDRSLIHRWIREAGPNTEAPGIQGEITPIELDERWHSIQSKNEALAHRGARLSSRADYRLGSRRS